MSNLQTSQPNPFALMMDPEAVFAALASSDRLARLESRVCRPLDKPSRTEAGEASDADAFEDLATLAGQRESGMR